MEEISKGNLAIEIPITQKDEIGILGKTFNKMIHDLKESRDKIEDYNKNLELKVEERTKELKETQEKLLQSSKMAAIGQLAGGVAHEINNPMGVILGFAQSVVKGIKEEDSLYMPLKSIEREALRCKN